jgi:lipopolysaccharide transport system permease protein
MPVMEATTASDIAPEKPTIAVEPPKGWRFPDLRELWRYRDLLYFLGRREIVIRYKQAAVGAFWAVLQPLMLAGLFAVFLGVIAKVESPTIPYALLAVTGLVLWVPFARALEFGTLSTVLYEPLITKIYVPRIAIPITSVASPALDMIVGFVIALAIAAGYGYFPSARLLAVPAIMVLALLIALGLALWFSALNVKYRDFALGVPTLTMIGLFITPITYPLSLVQQQINDQFLFLYYLNPMVGVLEAFRWALLGTSIPDVQLLVMPVVAAIVLLVSGALFYERAQKAFADVI